MTEKEKKRLLAKAEKLKPRPMLLPSGSWRCQVMVGGVRQSATGETPEEAHALAIALKGGLVEKSQKKSAQTLRAALDRYISVRSNVLSPSTIRGYRMIQKHRFQTVMDSELDKLDWQRVCNNEAKLCSAKTLANAWGLVVSVLREENLPVPSVKLPQVIANERPFLEPDQIPIFIKAVSGTDVEIPALLALHGLRRSEICALTWEHIDFSAKIIQVKGAAVFGADNRLVRKKENKNKSSARRVPIMIHELYEALYQNRGSGIIISCSPNTIWAQINRICKKEGLPEVGVHGLRHSFASLCYHLGVSEKVAMQLGGWSDATTMHNIYTHIAQMDMHDAVSQLTDYFAHEIAHEK